MQQRVSLWRHGDGEKQQIRKPRRLITHTHSYSHTHRHSLSKARESHQQDALPGHPAYGQHGAALDAVVVAAVQVSAHAEVRDLDGELPVQEAVPRGQVTVDEVQRRQIFHPRRYLDRHMQQVCHAGGDTDGQTEGGEPAEPQNSA